MGQYSQFQEHSQPSQGGRPQYAELHAHSAFTFLEAGDFPEELVRKAAELGLCGLGVLDVDGMYSAVQTAKAGSAYGLPIVHGTELTLDSVEVAHADPFPAHGARGRSRRVREREDTAVIHVIRKGDGVSEGSDDPGIRLPVLATSQTGYHTLCSLLSSHFLSHPGRRKASLELAEIAKVTGRSSDHGMFALTGTTRGPLQRAIRAHGLKAGRSVLELLKDVFGADGVAVEWNLRPNDPAHIGDKLALLAKEAGLPLVVTGAVRIAGPERSDLADVLGATRLGKPLEEAEPHLPAWRSFLRSPDEVAMLCSRHPEAVDNAVSLARRCAFDLDLIAPGLPHFPVPKGSSEAQWLRHVTYLGAEQRYGTRKQHPQAWQLIDHELQVIEQLGFPGYFLIVKDIVDFCRRSGILCQGRGSAANSAVCYALGITAVDAVKHKMLFERFLSPDRTEAPDIDLDIEANERERAIQYVYNKYGRDNAAQVANVISYRPRSAVRDAGKALGYSDGLVRRWGKSMGRHKPPPPEHDPGGPHSGSPAGSREDVPAMVLNLAAELQRLPRHMGLHPGGMVLTHRPVSQVCPVMWAAKEDRSVLQWDKEDCADAGLVKFDLLGLGMLTALRRAYTWLEAEGVSWNGRSLDLYNLPEEDPRVYDLLCAADTVGVFQVESRAQMNTLPRLKPRKFYDIVIEVALIRPGPIQGNAVSPYLRRRNGREEPECLHPLMEPALKKTLGVPLFQEQLMQIAVAVAGFTPGQADLLRRAIGSKRSNDRMESLKPALEAGMSERGIDPNTQEMIFEQLKGFAQFGFPESHAFSFAYLVYASAWLKVHYPEHFYASLLASQPMGFYSPSSLIEDARRHDIRILPPSVVHSEVKTIPAFVTNENPQGESMASEQQLRSGGRALVDAHSDRAVRIGLETINGLGDAAERITAARIGRPFSSLADLAARARLSAKHVESLAAAGALTDLGVSRREGLWVADVVGKPQWHQPYLPGTEPGGQPPSLAPMSASERTVTDYRVLGLSVERHPMTLLRDQLRERGITPLSELPQMRNGTSVFIAGIVTHRQRPATAKGVTFLSLEDETGLANVICTQGLWTRYRQVALESVALIVRGRVERGDGAVALAADKMEQLAVPVRARSRDFQ